MKHKVFLLIFICAIVTKYALSQKCDCDIFPVSQECKKECGLKILQSGTEEQIIITFNVSRETAKNIINVPNRKTKKTLEDFQDVLPYKYYVQLENNYNSWINNTNINQTNSGGGNNVVVINPREIPIIDTTIRINIRFSSNIYFYKGNKIIISASGSMTLGQIVGQSGPDGIQLPFINQYNIIKDYKHGALIFKYDEDKDWLYCGSSYNFIAPQHGHLIFNINDNNQLDNSGFYEVHVTIYKGSSAN